MSSGIRRRLFGTDYEAWNNRWYVYVGAPVFAVLGYTVGFLFGVHLVDSEPGEWLIIVLCMPLTMYLGFAGLAVLDVRN